jgi:hypothetical protein
MKKLVFLGVLLASAPLRAEEEPGQQSYMPISATGDHMLIGREIPGYKMRYDLAKQAGYSMVLLPQSSTSFETTAIYFAAATLPRKEGSLKDFVAVDMKAIMDYRIGTKVVRSAQRDLPHGAGACEGAQMAYPPETTAFAHELFFLCDAGSEKHALLLSLNAKTPDALSAAEPDFYRWMDVPQRVEDEGFKEDRKANPVTMAAGALALLFGLGTYFLRLKAPEELSKMKAMKQRFGEKKGLLIHTVSYTVLPMVFGAVLILAGLMGFSLFR